MRLDRSKLLGFRIVDRADRDEKTGHKLGTKLGTKLGSKVGVKA